MPIYTITMKVETIYELDIIADNVEDANESAYKMVESWGTKMNTIHTITKSYETPTDRPYTGNDDD